MDWHEGLIGWTTLNNNVITDLVATNVVRNVSVLFLLTIEMTLPLPPVATAGALLIDAAAAPPASAPLPSISIGASCL